MDKATKVRPGAKFRDNHGNLWVLISLNTDQVTIRMHNCPQTTWVLQTSTIFSPGWKLEE